MDNLIARLLDDLSAPGHLLVYGLVLAVILRRTRFRRAGKTVLVGIAVLMVAIMFLPLGAWLANPLENRFAEPEKMPDKVDGIIVLGGAFRLVLSYNREQLALNRHAERLNEFVGLARRYPEAKLVFTGGKPLVGMEGSSEAVWAEKYFNQIGFDADRVMFEGTSHNTYENAEKSKQLAVPQPNETWILITSAVHMPRAVGSFQAVDWSVVPYPVDYISNPEVPPVSKPNLVRNLEDLTLAMHEWFGLIGYRWLGRTNRLLPPSDGRAKRTAQTDKSG